MPSCGNVLRALYDHRPCEEDSVRGRQVIAAKRSILGIIVAVGTAFAMYYLATALAKVSNPYRLSPLVQKRWAIAGAVLWGVLILTITAIHIHSTIKVK